jgi:hypothetical protein
LCWLNWLWLLFKEEAGLITLACAQKYNIGTTRPCCKALTSLVLMLLLRLNYTQATTYKVPDDYVSIQAASAGDMIWVAQGATLDESTLPNGKSNLGASI